ncbi:enoyl-CoA hydratase/isomerase family protein [Bdellovibrio svalbardensis]|uniref:Enoyl-CoA hydratase-related protein n=1 Tax=Bdellovibrio svalbardensis TaxID=2972972 RepID=A0ABT6DMV1_9BACT|nr:enoyl-CoA hydratase-related protein [Bdellovibrio svalbardensis]MDG0818205.1 enoyl-CoA hydratase-related protein [Bdellovibrio svalbardensis]
MDVSYKTLLLEQKPNGVWILTINRPEALNALNSTVLSEMGEVLRQIGEMSYVDARVLIITGAGEKAFVAGADIKEIHELDEEKALTFAQRGQSIFHEFTLLKIPVIAAVNGFALGGGCELALGCDFIYASENAKFGLPEVSLGLIPGFGGTVRMARAVGQRKARELTYTGGMITAAEALTYGLVNKVVPQAELMTTVMKTVDAILSKAPVAVGAAKFSINQAWDMDVEEAQKNEAKIFSELFHTADVKEGTGAFIEKRKANFKGE